MIIGRTKLNVEQYYQKSTLSAKKYYYISHLSRQCLIENNITELPITLSQIIINNHWKLIQYEKLKSLNNKNYNSLMSINSGFAEYTTSGEYVIFYDSSQPITTQRFTIAHEIGHILLHHFNYPNENREQEANMFAARLLMPMCVLYECKVKNAQEVADLCNVSFISANYRYERLLLVKNRKKFYTDKNEKKLRNLFKTFIKHKLKSQK